VQVSAAVGEGAVQVAGAVERPSAFGGVALTILGVATAQPEIVTAGSIMTYTSLTCNLTRTAANPTPENLKSAAVQTGLTLLSSGMASGIRSATATGRLTYSQAVALTAETQLGIVSLGQASSQVGSRQSSGSYSRVPGMITPEQ